MEASFEEEVSYFASKLQKFFHFLSFLASLGGLRVGARYTCFVSVTSRTVPRFRILSVTSGHPPPEKIQIASIRSTLDVGGFHASSSPSVMHCYCLAMD